MPLYRVERHFQRYPNYATSDYVPPPQVVDMILETEDLQEARRILKDVALFPKKTSAWKILIVDHANGWVKRVEDEERGGIWVYRVLCQGEKDDWVQCYGV